jgi:hypothetical protein
MHIAIIPILVGIIVFALAWYIAVKLIADAFILNLVQVILAVLFVLWILGVLTGYGPSITIGAQ